MTIRDQFVDAMSDIVSSVSIVTTGGPAGRAGATISAMTSVSADGDAPTMLICLHHETTAAPAILGNACFCINVLDHSQSEIADIFAGRVTPASGDKFDVTEFAPGITDAPRFSHAVASFECLLKSSERIGTHHLMIGAVQAVTRGTGSPLLYGSRRYTRTT